MSPDDRRPFRGASFERGRGDRSGQGPDRGDRPGGDRPPFGAPRPFVRPPTRGGDMPAPEHRVHLRDGDREVEVWGNPAFVRQVLDDLPALMGRLAGAAPGRTAISMPAPPPPAASNGATKDLEHQVFEVLRGSSRPLPVSAIRERLDGQPTGQEVRRLLERAGDRVTRSQERPATYSLR